MIKRLAKRALNLNAWMVAAGLGVVVSVATCDRVRINGAEKRGGQNLEIALNKDAKEKADEARKARAPARRPGAAERVRNSKDSCRDC